VDVIVTGRRASTAGAEYSASVIASRVMCAVMVIDAVVADDAVTAAKGGASGESLLSGSHVENP